MTCDDAAMWSIPVFRENRELIEGKNPFLTHFGSQSESEWLATLTRSIETPVLDGVAFPRFPPAELQMRIHGNANEVALEEAFGFYRAIKERLVAFNFTLRPDHRILDFGTGWGRILRPFLREVELNNLFGYEPNVWFSSLARSLNPYVNIVNGSTEPPTTFAHGTFDLISSWSVLSHLSETLAKEWLQEFVRISRPGAMLFITTWGVRFFELLEQQAARQNAGEEIHWYHKMVLDGIGDLAAAKRQFESGQFVFIDTHKLGTYGEAFISRKALELILPPELECVEINLNWASQDILIMRRR